MMSLKESDLSLFPMPNFNGKGGAIATALVVGFGLLLLLPQCVGIVNPGERGVKITAGVVSNTVLPEGIFIKTPIVDSVATVVVRQTTEEIETDILTKDLQKVTTHATVSYKIPEKSVISLYRDYRGEVYGTLVQPRVMEALKSVASHYSAAEYIQNPEKVTEESLHKTVRSLTGLVDIVNVTIKNVSLTPTLQEAIELKQQKEQEAKAAEYEYQKKTLEAKAIAIQATALAKSKELIELEKVKVQKAAVEKWDGHLPQTVMGGAMPFIPVPSTGK